MIISKYFDYYPYTNVFIYIIYLFVGKDGSCMRIEPLP